MITKTVLLVEDNADDELLARTAFANMDFAHEVVVARDGEEALAYLYGPAQAKRALGASQPLVVLLDLNLPGISGLEVLKQIRLDARTRLFPVVVLSSSLQERDLVRSYSLGANSYIRKPVDFTEFEETVRQLASYWLQRNQVPPDRGYA